MQPPSSFDPRDQPPTTGATSGGGLQALRRTGLTPVNLFLVLLVAYVVLKVQIVLVLVVLAILFATIIERPVQLLERRRFPRAASIFAVYGAIIGTLVLAGFLIAPTIREEADRFRDEAPAQLRELRDEWRTSSNGLLRGAGVTALGRAIAAIEQPTAPPEEYTIGIVTGIGGGIVGLITVLVMAFYYLMEKRLLRRLILEQMAPTTRERVNRVWDDVEAQVGRWMRGQLLLMLIIGTVSTIGYGVMDLRFWPLLGLFAGLTEAIPIIGPWLGGVPAVVIAMTDSWNKAFAVAIFVVAMQTTENWVLVPRVMRGAVGLTPLTVLVAILAGTAFMSVLGAFLAIPVAAAVQVIVADYLRGRREARQPSDLSAPAWRWLREPAHVHIHSHDPIMPDAPPRATDLSAAPIDRDKAPSGAESGLQVLTRVGDRLRRGRGGGEPPPGDHTPA